MALKFYCKNYHFEIFRLQQLLIYSIDQDILNIYFHFHPRQMYVGSCEWHYHRGHCADGNRALCKSDKIKLIHGNGFIFHSTKLEISEPIFAYFYEAIQKVSTKK